MVYTLASSPARILADFLVGTEKVIVKLLGNSKGHRKARIILRKKNKAGGLTHPGFKTQGIATVIMTMWPEPAGRCTHQGMESEAQK